MAWPPRHVLTRPTQNLALWAWTPRRSRRRALTPSATPAQGRVAGELIKFLEADLQRRTAKGGSRYDAVFRPTSTVYKFLHDAFSSSPPPKDRFQIWQPAGRGDHGGG